MPIRKSPRVRRFNRFYTRQVGLLGRRLAEQPILLTEVARSMNWPERADNCRGSLQELGLDAGYLRPHPEASRRVD